MLKGRKENDRRTKWRFGIERELRYKLMADDVIIGSGAGRTLDISSSGVAFLGEHNIAPGTLIELSISWPVLLEDSCPMRLVIFGRVVRNSSFCTACTVDKYEFRTQGRVFRDNSVPIRHDDGLRRWAEAIRTKPNEARASA